MNRKRACVPMSGGECMHVFVVQATSDIFRAPLSNTLEYCMYGPSAPISPFPPGKK